MSRADGLRTGPPDFVGVGAFGWASGPWHELLRRHPDIEEPAADEPWLHFFDEFCLREMRDADIARYHELFPRPAGSITGEWTGRYMYDPWTPPLLHRAAPDAKILIILGDPIERFRERVAFKAYEGHADDELYMADVLGRGRYASQLRALLEHYERERVLVLQHERCRLDPLGEYRRTLRFLGVADDYVPRRLARWRPDADDRDLRFPTRVETVKRIAFQTITRRRDPEPVDLWPELEAALHRELDPEVEVLQELAEDLDLSLWPNFSPGTRTPAA